MTVTYPLDTPLSRNPVIAVTVLGALATITTALRFWALEMRRMSPEASEYIILAALVGLTGNLWCKNPCSYNQQVIVYADIALEYIRMFGDIPELSVFIFKKRSEWLTHEQLLDYGRGNGHQYDEEKFWTRSTLHRALPFPAIGGPLSQSPLGSTELEGIAISGSVCSEIRRAASSLIYSG